MRGVKSGRHDSSCTHCVGRPDVPPSSSFEWQTNPAKKSGKVVAAHSAGQSLTPVAFFVREITPAQHAPPASPDRHLLLLNVFRI